MTEDFFILLEAMSDDEQWKQWESEAAKLELPVDYYLQEFILVQQ
jgi:hypothetical protein